MNNIMENTPIPENDKERLQSLYEYQILDTDPELAYDEITEILPRFANAP